MSLAVIDKHFHSLPSAHDSNVFCVAPAADALSPVLLKRARDISKEHAELSGHLSNTFDGKVAKRVAEIATAANALEAWEKASKVSSDPVASIFTLSSSFFFYISNSLSFERYAEIRRLTGTKGVE